ncbi:hypothetical protein PGB90_002896 [Kerria lacca]
MGGDGGWLRFFSLKTAEQQSRYALAHCHGARTSLWTRENPGERGRFFSANGP